MPNYLVTRTRVIIDTTVVQDAENGAAAEETAQTEPDEAFTESSTSVSFDVTLAPVS